MGKLQDTMDSEFWGTSGYYNLGVMFQNTLITDGVRYFVEEGNALWCITDMLAVILNGKYANDDLLIINVTSTGSQAKLEILNCDDEMIHSQEYDMTDLEEGEYNFCYSFDGKNRVLCLMSER